MLQWAKYTHLNINKPDLQLSSFVQREAGWIWGTSGKPVSFQDVIKEQEAPVSTNRPLMWSLSICSIQQVGDSQSWSSEQIVTGIPMLWCSIRSWKHTFSHHPEQSGSVGAGRCTGTPNQQDLLLSPTDHNVTVLQWANVARLLIFLHFYTSSKGIRMSTVYNTTTGQNTKSPPQ